MALKLCIKFIHWLVGVRELYFILLASLFFYGNANLPRNAIFIAHKRSEKFHSSGLINSNFIQFTISTPTHNVRANLLIFFAFPEHFYATFIHFNDRNELVEEKKEISLVVSAGWRREMPSPMDQLLFFSSDHFFRCRETVTKTNTISTARWRKSFFLLTKCSIKAILFPQQISDRLQKSKNYSSRSADCSSVEQLILKSGVKMF